MDILDYFDAATWSELLAKISGPAIRIGLVLVFAVVFIRLAKRALRRWVQRAERNEPGVLQRLENRTGIELTEEVDPIVRVRRERRVSALAALADSVTTVVIWSIAVMMILAQVGIDLGPILASAGIVGVALGFGAQDLVKDFLSGVFILAEDQYGVGDVVDVGEATGVVEGVTLRSTALRDVEGTLWHVPNGEIRRVGNMSQGWARTLIDIDVAYDTDLERAKQVILGVALQMADEDPWAAKFLEPPEVWGVERLGADGISIRLVIKVLPGEQWGISRELRQRVKGAFDSAGIEIPFPQRTLWVRNGSSPVTPEASSEVGDPQPGTRHEAGADVEPNEQASSS